MTDRELIADFLRAWESGKTDMIMMAMRAMREQQERPQPRWRDPSTAEIKALWNATKKPSEFAELLLAKVKYYNQPISLQEDSNEAN
jgi:hypothetical protein